MELDINAMSIEDVKKLQAALALRAKEERLKPRVQAERNKSGVTVLALYWDGMRMAHTQSTWKKIAASMADTSENGVWAGTLY